MDEEIARLRVQPVDKQLCSAEANGLEESYVELVDALPCGVAIHSGGVIRYVNPAALKIIGASNTEEVLDRPLMDFVHPDQHALVRERMKTIYTHGVAELNEEVFIDVNGDPVPVEVKGTRTLWNGQPASQIVFRDVRGRQDAQKEALRLAEELEHTRRLETVGRLAGGIAHDFNNALTGILGFTELIEMTHEDDVDLMADLRQIRRAAERAADLTRHLSAFSRRRPGTPVLIDVSLRLNDLQKLLQRLLIRHTLKVEFQNDCGHVRMDPIKFEQIVMNLAVNARDAMEQGVFTIRGCNAEDTYVELTFSDQGEGIDPETLVQVFDPFFTTRSNGTGLGLTTVREIVEHYDGEIRIESEPGVGTTVIVRLPRAQGDVTLSAVGSVPVLGGKQEMILVVDDDPLVRRLTQRVLEIGGYRVIIAENATGGLEALEANPEVMLLLSDVLLPDFSGPELCAQALAKYPKLHVAYMSGFVDERLDPFGGGNLDYLAKPFTTDALLRWVRDALLG